MRTSTAAAVAMVLSIVAACGDDASTPAPAVTVAGAGGGTGGGSSSGGAGGGTTVDEVTVSGTVVDFVTGDPVTTSATVTVVGLTPPPTITVTGATFTLTGVAPYSVFQLLSGAPPMHRNTYNVATVVTDTDLGGVRAAVVDEAFLTAMETAFGVAPSASTGILIGQVIDDVGAPRAGISASAFLVNGATPSSGPFFLDEAMAPDPGRTNTSASGYVVFYDVPAGVAEVSASPGSNLTIVAPSSPVSGSTVTLMTLEASDGELMIPTGVSFTTDVLPIFVARGCVNCHSGNSIGADLGDLALNGGDNKVFKELTEEVSPTHGKVRVDLNDPAASLVLTMPSVELPPDSHPNVTFASSADPDFLTLLGWITDGAPNN